MPATVKRHNVKLLLVGREQQSAARLLYNILLLRRRLAGMMPAYFARKLNISPTALSACYNELAIRLDKENGGAGTVIPYTRLRRDQYLYAPILDRLEAQAAKGTENPRVEALIRNSFLDDATDLVIFRAKEKRLKGPRGRPKGSKSKKNRDQVSEAGWPMPDGTRA